MAIIAIIDGVEEYGHNENEVVGLVNYLAYHMHTLAKGMVSGVELNKIWLVKIIPSLAFGGTAHHSQSVRKPPGMETDMKKNGSEGSKRKTSNLSLSEAV